MNTMITLELIKMKRRRFFLPLIGFCVVGFFWCMAIVMKEWQFSSSRKTIYVLINDLILVNSMILPLFIGTLCSRLIEIEYSKRTFSLLQTNNQNITQLFISKAITASLILFILDLVQSIFTLVMCSLYNITIDGRLLGSFFISFLLASFVIVLLQLSLSLFFEKQSISMVLALIGSFVGLVTSGMLPWFIELAFPWQYYNLLNPIKRVIIDQNYQYSFSNHYFIVVFLAFITLAVEVAIIGKKLKGAEII